MIRIVCLFLVALFAAVFLFRHPSVAHLQPHPGPVVFLGDSLTYGTGAQATGGYVKLLQGEFPGRDFVNKGIPGDTTAGGLQRLQKDVLDLHPALVVVGLGGNDFLQKVPPDEIFGNLDRIVDRIQAERIPVLLLGIRTGALSDPYESRFRELAKRRQTGYVPDIMQGIFTNASLKADNLHPNDAGYKQMARRIGPELKWMLEKL